MVPAPGRQRAGALGSGQLYGLPIGQLADSGAAELRRRLDPRGEGEEQDIVLATGQGELQRALAELPTEIAKAPRLRERVAFQSGSDTAFAAEPVEIESQAVGKIDGGHPAAPAKPLTELELGLG